MAIDIKHMSWTMVYGDEMQAVELSSFDAWPTMLFRLHSGELFVLELVLEHKSERLRVRIDRYPPARPAFPRGVWFAIPEIEALTSV